MTSPPLYTLTLNVPPPAVASFEAALAPFCQSVAWPIDDGGGLATVSGIADGPPDRRTLDLALTLAAAAAGVPVPEVAVDRLRARDWLADNLAQFPPITIGRFHIHAEHVTQAPPPGLIGLRIEPGMAFGTGEHPSTEGVLRALDALYGRRRVRRAFDIGCGSGILGIAIARLFRCEVIALDNDPRAVDLTRQHARLNGVAPRVRSAVADGYRSHLLRRAGRADLIVSNILARPLMRMAGDLSRHLAPGGVAILAGFVGRDARAVLAHHQAHGLTLARTLPVAQWRTLVLTVPPAGSSPSRLART